MTKVKDERSERLRQYMDECREKEHSESQLIAILHKAQEIYGYLPREVMDEIAHYMNIPTAHIWGVATFYHYFNLEPVGKYIVSVCMGTACYVKGAGKVLETLKKELGVEVGQTTEDKMFTLQEARCLGACGLAPVIMVNEKIHGDLDAERTAELIKEYRNRGG
ncbi:MAG: NADH-quinone oxidoreductase subunit NuoE [Candidatus Omnitrophica bacterium]|nr:NADH-quinone oxidoreductase subunit NuoE [Candidatus Omnitrophota bacterium]